MVDFLKTTKIAISSQKNSEESFKHNHFSSIPKEAPIVTTSIKPSWNLKYENLITSSIEEVYQKARKASSFDSIPILIEGETGVGKEHLAKEIHKCSKRKLEKLYSINCAQLIEPLGESELFGHIKGAFTGAIQDKKGYFEVANNSTLFLDEVGDLSPRLQGGLLRVLETGEFQKVGSTKTLHTNARIISATNKNLLKLVNENQFRDDLYGRLARYILSLPPLRERAPLEIEQYLNYLLDIKADENKLPRLNLSSEALQILKKYSYPLNFRSMISIIETLYIDSEGYNISQHSLPSFVRDEKYINPLSLEYAEKKQIEKVLCLTKGNFLKARGLLEIQSPNTLKAKIKKYDIKI